MSGHWATTGGTQEEEPQPTALEKLEADLITAFDKLEDLLTLLEDHNTTTIDLKVGIVAIQNILARQVRLPGRGIPSRGMWY